MVHVPLYEVSAEARRRAEGALEIHARPALPPRDCGAADRLRRRPGFESPGLPAGYGEAGAVHVDARSHCGILLRERAVDLEADAAAAARDAPHPTDRFDQTGEHRG